MPKKSKEIITHPTFRETESIAITYINDEMQLVTAVYQFNYDFSHDNKLPVFIWRIADQGEMLPCSLDHRTYYKADKPVCYETIKHLFTPDTIIVSIDAFTTKHHTVNCFDYSAK